MIHFIIPDMHLPYQDNDAVACVSAAIRRIRPNRIVVLGDMLDAEAFSSHPKASMVELRSQSFEHDEILPARALLDEWQGKDSRPLTFIEGNHEARIEICATKLSLGMGSAVFDLISPRRLLMAGRKNATWVPYAQGGLSNHFAIAPNLWAVHGWSFAKHAAAVHSEKARTVSIVHGHTHRQQQHTTRIPATDDILKAWSPGCLCKFQPLYMYRTGPTDWVHGFSIIYQSDRNKNDWTDYTIAIQRGRCILPDGREVRV